MKPVAGRHDVLFSRSSIMKWTHRTHLDSMRYLWGRGNRSHGQKYVHVGSIPFPKRLMLKVFATAEWSTIFTRESSYCFQRVLAIAILSVCSSVTRVDQSKTVQARITKSSPSGAWKTLVSGTFPWIQRGSPRTKALNERGVGKICDLWPIGRCISVTVQDRA